MFYNEHTYCYSRLFVWLCFHSHWTNKMHSVLLAFLMLSANKQTNKQTNLNFLIFNFQCIWKLLSTTSIVSSYTVWIFWQFLRFPGQTIKLYHQWPTKAHPSYSRLGTPYCLISYHVGAWHYWIFPEFLNSAFKMASKIEGKAKFIAYGLLQKVNILQ